MNRRLLPLIAIAFVISGVSTLLLYKLIAPRFLTKPEQPRLTTLVAARTLEPGTLIREPDVRVKSYSGTPPPGLVRVRGDAVGRGVVSIIYAGEPVHEGRLAPKGAGAGLASLIPPGMRAVAVKVNEVVGVAGFVLPGMRVDVLISGRPPQADKDPGTMTRTLLQNVQVLSAGGRLHKDADGKPVQAPVVNLLVTPAQAEMLSLAGTETRIQLVLRNPLDVEIASPPGTAVAKLFGSVEPVKPPPVLVARRRPPVPRKVTPPAAVPRKPEAFIIEILHGAKRTESRF